MRTATAAAALALVLSSSAFAASKPLAGVPLQWRPTTEIAELKIPPIDLVAFGNTKVKLGAFTEARSGDPALIGENREDEKKGRVLTVTTKDDVPAFVAQHLGDLMKNVGLTLADAGATTTVTGEVMEFLVTEVDTYKAQVRLKVTVSDPKGNALWASIVQGSSERFGRSYKADNYCEALSDAVLEAGASLLRDPGFLKAAQGKK